MRFSVLVTSYPEYRALRARSRSLALLWQCGHGALALSPLFILGAGIVLLTAHIDPDLTRERSPWPIVASLLLWAVLLIGSGVLLQRRALKKGGVSNGGS